MSITIWDVEIIDEAGHIFQHVYFFTRKSAKRYVEKRMKEWEANGWTWCTGGEPLHLGRIKD